MVSNNEDNINEEIHQLENSLKMKKLSLQFELDKIQEEFGYRSTKYREARRDLIVKKREEEEQIKAESEKKKL